MSCQVRLAFRTVQRRRLLFFSFASLVLQCLLIKESASRTCKSSYWSYHGNHTACKTTNKSCKVIKTGVASANIASILSLHNSYRNYIASGNESTLGFPSSSNMVALEWSSELAAIAQAHANQCAFQHECYACRRSDEFETVGQNLFLLRSSRPKVEPDWSLVIRTWYDELRIAPRSVVRYFHSHGANIGHFTQMAWANTMKIGCGFSTFAIKNSVYRIGQLYTCNYGPAGNYIGLRMYEQGPPASHCPSGSRPSSSYGALCELSSFPSEASIKAVRRQISGSNVAKKPSRRRSGARSIKRTRKVTMRRKIRLRRKYRTFPKIVHFERETLKKRLLSSN